MVMFLPVAPTDLNLVDAASSPKVAAWVGLTAATTAGVWIDNRGNPLGRSAGPGRRDGSAAPPRDDAGTG
jgi:hypothetical protein